MDSESPQIWRQATNDSKRVGSFKQLIVRPLLVIGAAEMNAQTLAQVVYITSRIELVCLEQLFENRLCFVSAVRDSVTHS